MTDSGIRYTVHDGLARLTLARPDLSNAIDLPAAKALGAAVARAGADPDVRVILIDAEGPRFCAGGDVRSMAGTADPAAYVAALATELDRALQNLAGLAKPVVAAVQGAAAGAGLAVVLAADVVIAARAAKFFTAYAAVGLTPDCGLSYQLPRAIGQQRALELALTGRALSADEALEWGLVSQVVEPADLAERAAAVARQLADASTFALGQAKRLIRASWTTTREQSGADEVQTIAQAITTVEAKELIGKFATSTS